MEEAKVAESTGPIICRIPSDLVVGAAVEAVTAESWPFKLWQVDNLRRVSNGAGIRVAVLDTAAEPNHPELAGRVVKFKNFTRDSNRDVNGHGHHCLGTVGSSNPLVGVSQGAELYAGKVLGDNGSGSDSGIADAIDWAVAEQCHIISMSLGASEPSSRIKAACDRAAAANHIIIAAAGNEGERGIGYPGGFDSCISVAAIDKAFKVAPFSSVGDKVDTSGPGVNIVSCRPGGGHVTMSGTSMATPFVSGLTANYLSALRKFGMAWPNVRQYRTLLMSRSVDLGAPGDDRYYGPGWVVPLLLALGAKPDPPPIAA